MESLIFSRVRVAYDTALDVYLRIAGFVAIGDLTSGGVNCLVADRCQGASAEHVVIDLATAHLNEGVAVHATCGQGIMGVTARVKTSATAIDVGTVDESATAVVINSVLIMGQLRTYEAVILYIYLSVMPNVTVLTATEYGTGYIGRTLDAYKGILGVSQLKEC